ncbi:MAG: YkgJ family cysteine cluster protein [Acidovorax sp.]|uniref:YkgJ family cysteine cluster protein n=1 Tax=Acidovorax sp. TaxID=1872122 RepID=UPI00391B22D3
MLSDDEQSAFQESIARVRSLAARALQQAHGADEAIAFTAQLHRSLDTVAVQASAAGPVPDCKAGCAHCCHVRVEATEPEVFRIAQHLAAELADSMDAITARLRQHISNAHSGAVRQPCSFLVDDRCAIYSVRPAACRKAHSLSVQHCATQAPQIPQNLRLLLDAEALMAGTAQAYGDVQLAANAHELNAAVLAAMTEATAKERWYQGDRNALGPACKMDAP